MDSDHLYFEKWDLRGIRPGGQTDQARPGETLRGCGVMPVFRQKERFG